MAIREHRAKQLAALTGALVLALAFGTARVQRHASESASRDASLERGLAVYDANGCARCHSLRGMGSPRAPLDGVGSRLAPAQIEAWIVGDPGVAGSLPASVRAAKSSYRDMPEADRAMLVAWLARQRAGE
jgi:mono/diheme cytochrome c family protein